MTHTGATAVRIVLTRLRMPTLAADTLTTQRRTFIRSPVTVQECDRAPRAASRSTPFGLGRGEDRERRIHHDGGRGRLTGRVTEFRTLRLTSAPAHPSTVAEADYRGSFLARFFGAGTGNDA
jgi:hypothetical protein